MSVCADRSSVYVVNLELEAVNSKVHSRRPAKNYTLTLEVGNNDSLLAEETIQPVFGFQKVAISSNVADNANRRYLLRMRIFLCSSRQ